MEIVVDFADQGARLVLDLSRHSEVTVAGEISLVWGTFVAREQVVIEGYAMSAFIVDLTTVYESLAGEARLTDWDHAVVLKVAGTDRFHGKAEVSGDWTNSAYLDAGRPEASVSFHGLLLEPEVVIALARQLKKFLHETGTSTELPVYLQPAPRLGTQLREWWSRRRHRDNPPST